MNYNITQYQKSAHALPRFLLQNKRNMQYTKAFPKNPKKKDPKKINTNKKPQQMAGLRSKVFVEKLL